MYANCDVQCSFTDWNIMKKLLILLLFASAAAGVIWYESKPTTVAVPVVTEEPTNEIYYEEPTTSLETTTTQVSEPEPEINFEQAGLHLEIRGVNGDDVDLDEVFASPRPIDELPADIQAVIQGCPGVTDRDMVVRVDSRVQLTSSLPAKVSVDYRTIGMPAVLEFSDGPSCQDDGRVSHDLKPGRANHFTYWVVITGYITPDSPDGDLSRTWSIDGPILTLPNLEMMYWRIWGTDVTQCNGLMGPTAQVHLAGYAPTSDNDCQPAATEDEALGSWPPPSD